MSGAELYASPVKAYKLARLVLVDGVLRFAPLNLRTGGSGFYTNPGEASCGEGHDHTAPSLACTCGFYAVSSREELWRLGWHTFETATLHVLLHGSIIEHRHGYRAQRQDTTAIEIAGRCWWCGEGADVLARRRRSQQHLAPSCSRCARLDATTIEQAAEALGCEVSFTSELDEKASTKVERHALLIQTAPAVVIAVGASVLSLITQLGVIASIGGLLAGGWLAPGRMLAGRVAARAGLSLRERHRVVSRSAGLVLFATMGGWAVAGAVSMLHTGL